MENKISLSTKVTILVLIILIINSITLGIFSYIIHRSDTINSNSDRIVAIAKATAMAINPKEFHFALLRNEKNEHYELLEKQLETIFKEEKLHYYYAGTFIPDAIDTQTAMIMYIEGHGAVFRLNGEVPARIFRDEARSAYINKETCVTDVYNLNMDGVRGLAAYAPIFDEEGNAIGIVGVIMSLEEALTKSNNFALLLSLISFVIFIIIIWFPIFYLKSSVAKPLLALQIASNKITKGDMDIYTPLRKAHDEVGALSLNFSIMKELIIGVHEEIENLVDNATNGNLSYRVNSDKYQGEWQDVIIKFNELMDAIISPINQAVDTLHEIATGNFKARIETEFKGDFEKIKIAVNSTAIDLDRYLIEKEETEKALYKAEQKSNRAKSEFLSRMSHEMRTPMNAIIGMTKIADKSDDISKLRYCLGMINDSAKHLLGIINDVLDMSKIEAGKFDLDETPMNIEKMLMKICNIIISNIEKKKLCFNVELCKNLNLNYIADELRLSQVITNLLSNAIKFTPEGGNITLTVNQTKIDKNYNKIKISVIDTGIGMNEEQVSRIFNAFEQADGSVSRKYGGTGLGLGISKNIVEKMGGNILVESKINIGSTFSFEVVLKRSPHQETIVFDGIRPEDINILIIDNEDTTRNYLYEMIKSFGMKTTAVSIPKEAIKMLNDKKTFDIIFLAYDLPETNGIKLINQLNLKIDKNTTIIITTYLEWNKIEKAALENNLTKYITKPLFPSSVLNMINEVIGNTIKKLKIKTNNTPEVPDFSNINLLLVEDIDINREIFIELLRPTNVQIDIAENGLIAVNKFKENANKYNVIIMDIQMPEMDGYQATKTIRELDLDKAKTIPIIAMTANAFKEDIERCLESGMNDHLAKPIDEKAVINKLLQYLFN